MFKLGEREMGKDKTPNVPCSVFHYSAGFLVGAMSVCF